MGLLDRLLKSPAGQVFTTTTVKQHFSITVPAVHATAVQAGLERWAQSKGWPAVVSAQRDGDNVKLALEHDGSQSGPPPEIDAAKMSEELQRVVKDAMAGQQEP